MGPITKTPNELVQKACREGIRWIDTTIDKLNKLQFEDARNKDNIASQLRILRNQLERADQNALSRFAIVHIEINGFIENLLPHFAELDKIQNALLTTNLSPRGREIVNSYLQEAFKHSRTIETNITGSIADTVAGKKNEFNINSDVRSYDASAQQADAWFRAASLVQNMIKDRMKNGLALLDEMVIAANQNFSGKERIARLEYLKEQRKAFEADMKKLFDYDILYLVEVKEANQKNEIIFKPDSEATQLLFSQALLAASALTWRELFKKWGKEGIKKDEATIRYVLAAARASNDFNINELRTNLKVPKTDKSGNVILGDQENPLIQDLFEKKEYLDSKGKFDAKNYPPEILIREQFSRVNNLLILAEKSLTRSPDAALRFLVKAADKSYDANKETSRVVGNKMQDYVRDESDKVGFKGGTFEDAWYALKSRWDWYGKTTVDFAVVIGGTAASVLAPPSMPFIIPAVASFEIGYWGHDAIVNINTEFRTTGKISLGNLGSSAAMLVPSAGALGLRLATEVGVRAGIRFTMVGTSGYLIGQGVYGIADAANQILKYGMSGATVEAIASGLLFMGAGLKGHLLIKKIVPARVAERNSSRYRGSQSTQEPSIREETAIAPAAIRNSIDMLESPDFHSDETSMPYRNDSSRMFVDVKVYVNPDGEIIAIGNLENNPGLTAQQKASAIEIRLTRQIFSNVITDIEPAGLTRLRSEQAKRYFTAAVNTFNDHCIENFRRNERMAKRIFGDDFVLAAAYDQIADTLRIPLRKAERIILQPIKEKPTRISLSDSRVERGSERAREIDEPAEKTQAAETPRLNEEPARIESIKEMFDFAEQFLSTKFDSATKNSLIKMLENHGFLTRDPDLFYHAVDELGGLPLDSVQKIIKLPENVQRFLFQSMRSIDKIPNMLTNIIIIDRVVDLMPDLDYKKDPRILELKDFELDRRITVFEENARRETAVRQQELRQNLWVVQSVRKQLENPSGDRAVKAFNKQINGILQALAQHGNQPLASFDYPKVTYKSKNMFTIELGKSDRAIFFVYQGNVYTIFIGNHKEYERTLDSAVDDPRPMHEIYPVHAFTSVL